MLDCVGVMSLATNAVNSSIVKLSLTVGDKSCHCHLHRLPSHPDLIPSQVEEALSSAPMTVRCALLESIGEPILNECEQQCGVPIHITDCQWQPHEMPSDSAITIAASARNDKKTHRFTLEIQEADVDFFAPLISSFNHATPPSPPLTIDARVIVGSVMLDDAEFQSLTTGDMVLYTHHDDDDAHDITLAIGDHNYDASYDNGMLVMGDELFHTPDEAFVSIEAVPVSLPLDYLEQQTSALTIPYGRAMAQLDRGHLRLCDLSGTVMAYGSARTIGRHKAILLEHMVTK